MAGVITDSLGRRWDPRKHPRDRKGRFIRTFHKVRLFNTGGSKPWGVGRVDKINDEGHIDIEVTALARNNPESAEHQVGEKYSASATNLESVNEKASLSDVKAAWNDLLEAVKNLLSFREDDNPDFVDVSTHLAKARRPYYTGGFRTPDWDKPWSSDDIRKQRDARLDAQIEEYLESLRRNGVDPDQFDKNAPDGLPAFQPLLDKQNQEHPLPNGWKEILPQTLDREFESEDGSIHRGLLLTNSTEGSDEPTDAELLEAMENDPDNWRKFDADSFEDMFTDEGRDGEESEEPVADLTPETTPTRQYDKDEFLAELEGFWDDDTLTIEEGENHELLPGYGISRPEGSDQAVVTGPDGTDIVKIPENADQERLSAAADKIFDYQQENAPDSGEEEEAPKAEIPAEEPVRETPPAEALREQIDEKINDLGPWQEDGFSESLNSVLEDIIDLEDLTNDEGQTQTLLDRVIRESDVDDPEDIFQVYEDILVRRAEPELEEERAERNPTDEDPSESVPDDVESESAAGDDLLEEIGPDGETYDHQGWLDRADAIDDLEGRGLVDVEYTYDRYGEVESAKVTPTSSESEEPDRTLSDEERNALEGIYYQIEDNEFGMTRISDEEAQSPVIQRLADLGYIRLTPSANNNGYTYVDITSDGRLAVSSPPVPDDTPEGRTDVDLNTPEAAKDEWKFTSTGLIESIGLTEDEVRENYPDLSRQEAADIADSLSALHRAIQNDEYIDSELELARENIGDNLNRDEAPYTTLRTIFDEGDALYGPSDDDRRQQRLDEIEDELDDIDRERADATSREERDALFERERALREERDQLTPAAEETSEDPIADSLDAYESDPNPETAADAIELIASLIKDEEGNVIGQRLETKEQYKQRYLERERTESQAQWRHDPEEFPVIEEWLLQEGFNPKNPALNKFMVDEKGPYRYFQRGVQAGQKVHVGDTVAVKFKQGKKTGLWVGTVSKFFGDSGNGGKIEIQFRAPDPSDPDPKNPQDPQAWGSPSGKGVGTIDYDNIFSPEGLPEDYTPESGRVLEPEIHAPADLSLRDEIAHFLDSWIGADNQDRFSRLDGNERLVFSNGYYLQAREDGWPLILTLHAPDGSVVDDMIDVPGYQEGTVARINDTESGNPIHKWDSPDKFIKGLEEVIRGDEENPGARPAPEPEAPTPAPTEPETPEPTPVPTPEPTVPEPVTDTVPQPRVPKFGMKLVETSPTPPPDVEPETRNLDDIVPDHGDLGPEPPMPNIDPNASLEEIQETNAALRENLEWHIARKEKEWRDRAEQHNDIFEGGPTLPVGDVADATNHSNRIGQPGHTHNCYNCVVAWALRMKGYDVEAEPNHDLGKGESLDVIMSRWWQGETTIQRHAPINKRSPKAWARDLRARLLADHGPESYGFVSAAHKGQYKKIKGITYWTGHVWVWYIDANGEVHWYEPQTGEEYDGDLVWGGVAPSVPVWTSRVDNLPLPTGEGVVPSGGAPIGGAI